MIGHRERHCKKNYNRDDSIAVRKISPDLRAVSRHAQQTNSSNLWLKQRALPVGEIPIETADGKNTRKLVNLDVKWRKIMESGNGGMEKEDRENVGDMSDSG